MRTRLSVSLKKSICSILSFSYLVFPLVGFETAESDSVYRVVTFMPDFYAFWDKAKDLPIEKKIELWDSLYESKHSDFYREAIFGGGFEESIRISKEQMLKEFLGNLSDEDIGAMKAKEQELKNSIPLVARKVDEAFSSREEGTVHYIIPSLNVTSGAGAPYKGDLIIFYGIEFMTRYEDPEYIQEMIAHQILHVIHYRKIAPILWKKYGTNGNLNVLLDREGPLFFIFREGLAISFAEKLFPGGDRPGIIEKNFPLFERNFQDYTKKFLQDLRNFTPEIYQNYFSAIQSNSDPPGFGFYLGYRIVKSLLNEFSLEQLLEWSPERAVQAVWDETKKILDTSYPLSIY